MKKKASLHSSTAEYLTYIAASGGDSENVEILYQDENIWLTQKMMAALYDVTVSAINQHLKTIFDDTELQRETTIKKYLIVQSEGSREVKREVEHYNLQAIIAVGFKINNERAVRFRKWAGQIVKDYTIQGWTMDKERIKKGHLFTDDYFERQLQYIREIRMSERKFYQKITDIYATSFDYDKDAKTTQTFFKLVQNKLHYAVHRHTAAELIVDRADAEKVNMGLTTWDGSPDKKIIKADVSIAKNYLNQEEMRYLERIVSMYLDYAELQAERKIPMSMEDWAKRLDGFLEFNGNEILTGRVTSHEEAKLHAETEYEKYRLIQDRLLNLILTEWSSKSGNLMSSKIIESSVENYAIELLEKQGYQYIYGPTIAPDSDTPARSSFEEVLLLEHLRSAIARINPAVSADVREDAIKQVLRISSPELIVNNETFHRLLTEGIKVTYQKNSQTRGDLVWLIDFQNPDKNEFLVVNQYTIIENHVNKRPDVILFVNGIPLVVMELKNPVDENATMHSAYNQLETYKQTIPSLFTYSGFLIISDGLVAKAGTISSGFTRFMAWKTADGKVEASNLISPLETLIVGMLNKKTLLDLVRHFIVFESSKKEDKDTGIISMQTIKKLASYHQYHAVNRAVESTLRASGYISGIQAEEAASPPGEYGVPDVKKQPVGDRKGGVVWHTQGSGKSLSMVFYTGKIVLAMDNPTVLVITDRNDLDDQLYDTFAASKQLLRQEPVQAANRDQLKDLLKVASGGVIFTTIQKFQPDEGNVYETLSDRTNIIVIADEAHRTQYGFKPKTIDDKDEAGNVVGKKIVYGFAKYMRDALPHATYLGFTGTPIESTDVNTPAVFGNYVDVYDVAQAVETARRYVSS